MKSAIVLCVIVISAAASGEPYPEYPLDKVLTQGEQVAIGVAKLSDAEKENLRVLIIEKYLAGYENGKKDAIELAAEAFVQNQGTPVGGVIESQIEGDYEGWEGETIVKLMNGQVWQQTEYYYHYHYAFMPKVLIYRSGSGYKMKVDGVDRAVGVTQLK